MENCCKCKTCKHLIGGLTFNDNKQVVGTFLCDANENCLITITYLLDTELSDCIDYVSYDTNITEEKERILIDSEENNCEECCYCYSEEQNYCSIGNHFDKSILCEDKKICQLFTPIEEKPVMRTKINAEVKDIQKLAIQIDKVGENNEN